MIRDTGQGILPHFPAGEAMTTIPTQKAHLVRPDQLCPSIEGLASEDTAERAIVARADLGHDLVHGPAIQVLVGHNLRVGV